MVPKTRKASRRFMSWSLSEITNRSTSTFVTSRNVRFVRCDPLEALQFLTKESIYLPVEPDLDGAFESWSAGGPELRIDYKPSVLNEIRSLTVDAFWRLPHGGLEIGGVLF